MKVGKGEWMILWGENYVVFFFFKEKRKIYEVIIFYNVI